MIHILYTECGSDHFTRELQKADSHVKHHREIGEIRTVTGSDIYILRICQAVRLGLLGSDEVKISFKGERDIDLDIKGDFIQPWPDELFEAAFYCIFDKTWYHEQENTN